MFNVDIAAPERSNTSPPLSSLLAVRALARNFSPHCTRASSVSLLPRILVLRHFLLLLLSKLSFRRLQRQQIHRMPDSSICIYRMFITRQTAPTFSHPTDATPEASTQMIQADHKTANLMTTYRRVPYQPAPLAVPCPLPKHQPGAVGRTYKPSSCTCKRGCGCGVFVSCLPSSWLTTAALATSLA